MLYLEARLSAGIGRWPVRGETFVVGREPGCDVVIMDSSISRRHVRITVDDGKLLLEDLKSTNGVHIAGKRLERAEIQPDEWFVVGTVMMTVREGVSLTSSDGSTSAQIGSRLPVQVRLTPPERSLETEAIDARRDEMRSRLTALSGLASMLDRAEDTDLVLQVFLDFLASFRTTQGVVLIEQCGNGWVLRAQSGEPLPPDSERAFLDAASQVEDSADTLREGAVLGRRVRNPAGPTGWLILHPWSGQEEVDPEVKLVASLCGFCLRQRIERPGDDSDENVPAETSTQYASDEFFTVAESCRKMLDELDRIASTELPILICGESGTGKELLARRLHRRSPRVENRFVAINCAALPRELLEAELFGIQKGVATGVSQRPGHLLLASGGTLLLDEIGEMPLELQPKLLRALESGEIIPLGAPAPIPVDVRLVASTNIDLTARVKEGSFRRDLFHRIAGATVHVPPLRERPEDVLPLARLFIRESAKAQGRPFVGLDLVTARCLIGYDWPGNVRELRHALARAVALADGPIIHSGLLPEGVAANSDPVRADAYLGMKGDFRGARVRFEHLYFSQLLERCNGNLSEASRLAKLTRGHLYTKLAELGLKK